MAPSSKDTNKPGMSRAEALAFLNNDARTNSAAYYTSEFRTHVYFLDPLDSPAITERLEKVANQIEAALPNFLSLTNQLTDRAVEWRDLDRESERSRPDGETRDQQSGAGHGAVGSTGRPGRMAGADQHQSETRFGSRRRWIRP